MVPLVGGTTGLLRLGSRRYFIVRDVTILHSIMLSVSECNHRRRKPTAIGGDENGWENEDGDWDDVWDT